MTGVYDLPRFIEMTQHLVFQCEIEEVDHSVGGTNVKALIPANSINEAREIFWKLHGDGTELVHPKKSLKKEATIIANPPPGTMENSSWGPSWHDPLV
jgi:hypothetical protein